MPVGSGEGKFLQFFAVDLQAAVGVVEMDAEGVPLPLARAIGRAVAGDFHSVVLGQRLQGQAFAAASEEELRYALEKAFDYRGDVTITLKNGSAIEGYIFDREPKAETIRIMTKPGQKVTIRYADVSQLAFTGRDMADGRSWEAWVRKYAERKAAGEKNIQLLPEALD